MLLSPSRIDGKLKIIIVPALGLVVTPKRGVMIDTHINVRVY